MSNILENTPHPILKERDLHFCLSHLITTLGRGRQVCTSLSADLVPFLGGETPVKNVNGARHLAPWIAPVARLC